MDDPAARHDYKFYFLGALFEKEQQSGDCALTGRFAQIQSSAQTSRIAVNNHQEEKQ